MMDVCTNEECQDAVVGGPIPCAMSRQQIVYCGFKAQYYKEKDKEPVVDNVIQLK